jgi:hypothetical protein
VTVKELKEAKDKKPFEPFFIRMADGQSYEIKHPDAVAWDPGNTRIAICGLEGGRWEIVDIRLVTSLGIPALESPDFPRADGNGD